MGLEKGKEGISHLQLMYFLPSVMFVHPKKFYISYML